MGYKRKTVYKLVLRDHKPPILWRISLWCHRAWLANPGTKWRFAKQNSQSMHSSQHFAASAFFARSPWRLTPYSTSQQITFSTSFSSISTSIESWRPFQDAMKVCMEGFKTKSIRCLITATPQGVRVRLGVPRVEHGHANRTHVLPRQHLQRKLK